MKVLIIGSGGREHAIAEKVSLSNEVSAVFVCPGNPGMKKMIPEIKLEAISASDIEGLLNFAKKEKIGLTIVGPEATLSLGIVDLFRANNLLIVGSTQKASLLETSKSFAKKIMNEAGVPTAGFSEFFQAEAALAYIESLKNTKMVVKCDGLAAGKGVVVCLNKTEACEAVNALMKDKLLGENVDHIIIEDFLEGVEVSAFALCDGDSFSFLGTACDHKRLLDGDLGPNTGGMGVFSPASVYSAEDELWVNENVFTPMLSAMKKNGSPFSGILFAGLMKTRHGWAVLEFNVRLGDPETQVLLPLIEEDLLPWFRASAEGNILGLQNKLGSTSPKKLNLVGVHVVMAAHGYPGTEGVKVRSGDIIEFNKNFKPSNKDYLFFAGVEKSGLELVTKGGRVLGISSIEENFSKARKNAYDLISQIHFDGAQFRRDIGSGQV
ncbi:MAG: phosphoribosylamine--glycine ligase [Bacteriovorax sp.]|nr:phosphoribosylamine--glycine ligase [Bacteriovorax sp.]